MQIQIQNVTKVYPDNTIGVKGISLELQDGMFGLLGPNGAGKTTLMRMIATLLEPTSGEIHVNGHSSIADPRAIRSVLGYLPQDFGVYPNLSAREFLEYMAILDGLQDNHKRKLAVERALEIVDLRDVARKKLRGFSGGMKQRVGVAQVLLKPRQLVIVDEPTAGLDPEERIRFRNLLSEISGDRLVILSTHIVADIEATCDDLAIIKNGQVLIRSSPAELIQSVQGKVWEAVVATAKFNEFKQNHQVITVVRKAENIHVRLLANKRPFVQSKQVPGTLEDAYLHYTNEEQL